MVKVDWDYWRHKYISGGDEVTLRSLAQLPGSPTYETLKNRSSKESWAEQRKRYIRERMTLEATQPGIQETVEQAARIIDAAEMLTRHMKAARLVGQKALQAMQMTDPSTLKPSDAINWIRWAVEAERLVEGMAGSKTELDLSKLSVEELEAIARGKSPD